MGESLMVAGRHPMATPPQDEPEPAPCPMLVLRAFTQSGAASDSHASADAASSAYDPYASTGQYDPYAALDAEESTSAGQAMPTVSDEEVMLATRRWVEAIIVKMKVCPFSSTADKAGMPIGSVTYPITHGSNGEAVYAAFWGQVLERVQHKVRFARRCLPGVRR